MKKLVMTVAVFACAASIASAQTVTSANMVGYNKAAMATGLQILGTQFDTGDNTPEGIFGDSLPYGSKIYSYNGGYSISTFTEGVFGNPDDWDTALDLGQIQGYWVQIPAGAYTNIISGEVYLDDSVTNSIVIGLQLVSYPYPVERTVSQMGFVPSYGDKLYKYAGGYAISTYTEGVFGNPDAWDLDFALGVGEGFWYQSGVNTDWIVDRPFTP